MKYKIEITKPSDSHYEAALRKWAYAKNVPYNELLKLMKSKGKESKKIIEI